MNTSQAFVSYSRVSTARQGASGLGLEAQEAALASHAAHTGIPILAKFVEVESGASRHRPQLAAALAECRRQKATLLIAKLDRLSRNLASIAQLLEANVEIRVADMPEANRFMLQVMGAFAEQERRMISDRTRAALAAAKARGVILGRHGRVLAEKHRRAAQEFAEGLRPVVDELNSGGVATLAALANALNARGLPSRDGGLWHPASAMRLVKRLYPSP